MADVTVKVGNTLRVRLRLQKRNDVGAWVPAYTTTTGLTGRIYMVNATGILVINQPVAVIQADTNDCIVEYFSTTPADSATAGNFRAEMKMTQASETLSYPRDRTLVIEVLPSLG